MWADTSSSPAMRSRRVRSLGQSLLHCRLSSVVDTAEELSCHQSGRTPLLTLISATTTNICRSKHPYEFRHILQAPSFENTARPSFSLSAPERKDPRVSKTTAIALLQGTPLTSPPQQLAVRLLDSLQQIWGKRWLLGPWDLRQGSGRSVSFVSLPEPGSFTPRDACV